MAVPFFAAGWKTFVFNVLVAILTVVTAFNWPEQFGATYAWVGIIIVNLANIALRFVTTSPIFKSAEPPKVE